MDNYMEPARMQGDQRKFVLAWVDRYNLLAAEYNSADGRAWANKFVDALVLGALTSDAVRPRPRTAAGHDVRLLVWDLISDLGYFGHHERSAAMHRDQRPQRIETLTSRLAEAELRLLQGHPGAEVEVSRMTRLLGASDYQEAWHTNQAKDVQKDIALAIVSLAEYWEVTPEDDPYKLMLAVGASRGIASRPELLTILAELVQVEYAIMEFTETESLKDAWPIVEEIHTHEHPAGTPGERARYEALIAGGPMRSSGVLLGGTMTRDKRR